jgi:hypothetical protein
MAKTKTKKQRLLEEIESVGKLILAIAGKDYKYSYTVRCYNMLKEEGLLGSTQEYEEIKRFFRG